MTQSSMPIPLPSYAEARGERVEVQPQPPVQPPPSQAPWEAPPLQQEAPSATVPQERADSYRVTDHTSRQEPHSHNVPTGYSAPWDRPTDRDSVWKAPKGKGCAVHGLPPCATGPPSQSPIDQGHPHAQRRHPQGADKLTQEADWKPGKRQGNQGQSMQRPSEASTLCNTRRHLHSSGYESTFRDARPTVTEIQPVLQAQPSDNTASAEFRPGKRVGGRTEQEQFYYNRALHCEQDDELYSAMRR